MSDKITILIADDQEEIRESIQEILELTNEFLIVGLASNGEDTIEKAKKLKPDVILMDINMPKLNGLEATEIISKEMPNIIVIIMSVQNETEYLKKAMMNGAKEYVIKPFDTEQIITTINDVVKKHKDRVPVETKIKTKSAKITSFFSAKGGVGKSVLATNFALLLSKTKKTLIIDANIYFGDIGVLMNSKSDKNLSKLIQDEAYSNIEFLEDYIIKSDRGVDLLLAPLKPEDAENISASELSNIIELVKGYYDNIIIDVATNYSEVTLTVLEHSDEIFLIVTPEITALKNTKLSLSLLKSLDFSDEKIKLIINKSNLANAIKKNKIESILNKKVELSIPTDEKNVMKAVQTGEIEISKFGFNKNLVINALNKIL